MRHDSEDVRQELEKQIGAALSDEQWDFLVSKRYDVDVLLGERGAEEVAAELREWWRWMAAGPAGTSRPMMLEEGRRSGSDAQRRQYALSVLLSDEAGRRDDVRAFREAYLPEGLLDWEELEAWVARQAHEAGAPTVFIGVPLPPGVSVRTDKTGAFVFEPELRISRLPGEAGAPSELKWLRYGTPETSHAQARAVVAGSTLDQLRSLSERLSAGYGWTQEQATVFALTGVTPLHALVRITREVRPLLPVISRIELSVDPSVTPEELAEYYRASRRRMMPGRRHRAQERKALELAIFAAGREQAEPLDETRRAWNEAVKESQPQWDYGDGQKRAFRRDLKRARARLLFPPYVDPTAAKGAPGIEPGGAVIDLVVRISGEDDR